MARVVLASRLLAEEPDRILDAVQEVECIFLVPSMMQQTLGSLIEPSKRFEQTIEGLQSIRQRVPDAFIIFFEAGKPEEEWAERICQLVNVYIRQDVQELNQTITSNKSLGEATMTSIVVNNIDPTQFRRFFKLSGRYSLSEDFDLDSFETGDNARAAFHRFSNGQQTWLGTMLYYVPSRLWGVYREGINLAPQRIIHGFNIETSMFYTFQEEEYVHRAKMGGIGECAYDGNIHMH